jgi:TatD DNase family protein
MFIDTHAHLTAPEFEGETERVIERALQAGIDYMIIPGTDIDSSVRALEMADKYEYIYAAVGVHPHDTKKWDDSYLDRIKELASHKKAVAIGEIGLDYYYDFSPKQIQIETLKQQIDLAFELGKPVILHSRDADEDMMNILRSYKSTGLHCQMHCFSGSLKDARELIELGHFISFTGNITFKNAGDLRDVVRGMQAENLLLETDSPYMSPVPLRGRRNEPANVPLIAEKIAELQNVSVDNIARATSFNAWKLFGIGHKPQLSYTYEIGHSLYINVTNRCNCDCIFCDRKGDAVIKGYSLKMNKNEEPDASEYIKQIGDPKKYKEIVFCGYGEPTIRWEVVKQVARYIKENGGKTRMNTNGHGNYINKQNITPELTGLIDVISISINTIDPAQYSHLMRVDSSMFSEMIDFAKKATVYTKVVLTAVGISEVDTCEIQKFVEGEIGAEYRTRLYF